MQRRRSEPAAAAASAFEKLGVFYLGKRYDLDQRRVSADYVLYDSKDLTTHAVCVGMTGSGKTGLCISMLEEAVIDGIPVIAIDPKGDLANLLLTFPGLRSEDFRPWVDEGAASRTGATLDEFARAVAETWKKGLAAWGQDGARVARLRDAAEYVILTPGSTAGVPLSLLHSFDPPADWDVDPEGAVARVNATASGLLALVGIDGDPVKSREHILLATILHAAWSDGRGLDLAALIGQVQRPTFDRIGVLSLETFFPERDRFRLAMTLNNLLASPGFASWMTGAPLAIPSLLRNDEGKPRVSVLSIAHLSDAERMFFVTIVLTELISWMRTQPGTASLRAVLYMDEVFGYLPPTANPPSKTPMLTLLKQARAYGVGLVLATQNPVDLDYKALSNAGTWFLGRLQTDRDKQRVLDGLEGASATTGAGLDRQHLERVLSNLDSRVFLMNNVHEDEPVLFHTRWAMSYLRGPLTRSQIQRLMSARVGVGPKAPEVETLDPARALADPPALPSAITQWFVRSFPANIEDARLVYRPALLASADLHFVNARLGIDAWENVSYLVSLSKTVGDNIWDAAELMPPGVPLLAEEPEGNTTFAALPAGATQAKVFATWQKMFKSFVYQSGSMRLLKCASLKITSLPGETEADFMTRVRHAAREQRDLALEKLRKRYEPKMRRLRTRLRSAEQRLAKEKSQYGQQKVQVAVSMGATVLGALFGRKAASVGTVGRAATTMRGFGRAAREREDIAHAEEKIEDLQEELTTLEAEFEEDSAGGSQAVDIGPLSITERVVRPRKSDIGVERFGLAWIPWWVASDGVAERAMDSTER